VRIIVSALAIARPIPCGTLKIRSETLNLGQNYTRKNQILTLHFVIRVVNVVDELNY